MVQKRGIMVALYGYYGYGYYYDPMYILIIISCVIALIAQVKVKAHLTSIPGCHLQKE